MPKTRTTLAGRDTELSELDAVLAGVTPARHTLAVVRGTPGIGKSTLVAAAEDRWRRESATVITVRFADGVESWDLFGAGATIEALRRHFEDLDDFGLADSINAVGKLCTPDGYRSARLRSRLLIGLARIFDGLRRGGPVVVIADDLDAVANPALAVAPACLPGFLVLAVCRDEARSTIAAVQLGNLADHLIDLGPVPEDCVDTVVRRQVGAAAEDSLLNSLRTALGKLACEPGTLSSTLDRLRAGDRIVTVHGKACLAGTDPIVLPADHDLVRQVRRLGGTGHDLMALAATTPAFGIEDLPVLAAATGQDLAGYGRAIDTLVAVGALVSTESGRLSSTCPALTNAVLDARVTEVLHAELAAHLLATGGDATVIADHLAESGHRMRKSRRPARLLVTEADSAAEAEPQRAARWYLAALRHLRKDDPARSRVLSTVTRLLTRLGRYDELGAVVEQFAGEFDRADLCAAAVLAALHTSTPVPPAVREKLADGSVALECHDRWFASGAVDAATLLGVVSALADGPVRDGDTVEAIVEAESVFDIAAVLHIGAGAGIPGTGPLACYHRVVTGYVEGDWRAALSAARELESTRGATGPASPVHHLGGLIAAEVSAATGDLRRAAAWLGTAGKDVRFTAMRSWVEAGIAAAAGDVARTLADGWWTYRQLEPEQRIGRERLLARLAAIAMSGGQEGVGRSVLAEATELADRMSDAASRAAVEFIRGVVTRDEVSLRASAEHARLRGHQPDLLGVCLVLGASVTEPRPWLHEALDIAQRLGAEPLRARVRTLMRDRGVSAPRVDGQRSTLSDTERRVIDLILDGHTNRRIALALRITEKTVEYHLSRLFVKTGCRSRVDLVAARVRGQLSA